MQTHLPFRHNYRDITVTFTWNACQIFHGANCPQCLSDIRCRLHPNCFTLTYVSPMLHQQLWSNYASCNGVERDGGIMSVVRESVIVSWFKLVSTVLDTLKLLVYGLNWNTINVIHILWFYITWRKKKETRRSLCQKIYLTKGSDSEERFESIVNDTRSLQIYMYNETSPLYVWPGIQVLTSMSGFRIRSLGTREMVYCTLIDRSMIMCQCMSAWAAVLRLGVSRCRELEMSPGFSSFHVTYFLLKSYTVDMFITFQQSMRNEEQLEWKRADARRSAKIYLPTKASEDHFWFIDTPSPSTARNTTTRFSASSSSSTSSSMILYPSREFPHTFKLLIQS